MDENEIKALVFLLEDEDREILKMVEQKLSSLGTSAIPYLEQALDNENKSETTERIKKLIRLLHSNQLWQRLRAWKESGGEDLLQGLWIVATYQFPELTYEELKNKLENLYYEVWVEFKDNLHPFDQIKILNHAIFSKLRFRPNNNDFHAVENSMINQILDLKKSNPIGLCVVYMLLARKLGVPLSGINLPNLFILTYKMQGMQFYINVFNKGLIFSRADIENYITQLNLPQEQAFYEPCTNLDILERVLRNLTVAFERNKDKEKANEIKKFLDFLEE
ncbi:MAG: hypothetical protein EAZ97_08035 [Bacteroidetes bacterium]|nr:MAG: hypothetical protein EAZ97_08035 [Bacteroidota bacterium]